MCRGASEIFLYAQIVRPIICMHACACACRRVRAIGDRERVHNFPFRSQTCARDARVCEGISRSFLCICTGDEIQNVCSRVLHSKRVTRVRRTCARHNIIVCALHVSAERRNNKHLLLVSLSVCVCFVGLCADLTYDKCILLHVHVHAYYICNQSVCPACATYFARTRA